MRSGLEGSRNALAAQTGGNAVAYNGLGRIVKIGGSGATALPPSATPVSQGLTQVDVWTLNGDRKLRVTIGSGGSARMCDPSPTLAQSDPRHCP
jgi:hypothetical protein